MMDGLDCMQYIIKKSMANRHIIYYVTADMKARETLHICKLNLFGTWSGSQIFYNVPHMLAFEAVLFDRLK